MPGYNWERVQELFLAAADLAESEQPAWLDDACMGDAGLREEVESLLRADRASAVSLSTAIETAAGALLEEPPIVGLRLGAYRVIREIGRGGIGAVYLAERDDDQFHKEVAIKIVKRGMDTAEILGRFRHERQILANLDHPYIARLIDGGTTPDGRPFFVMEYVEGQAIDAFFRDRSLSVEERLELFLRVCEAVSYAHRSLVVHRDLKPGNILVTADGIPKLLDFGVAKLLNPVDESPGGTSSTSTVDTMQSSFRILTPAYASPEQVRGDPVTVASDIYSLAAALYELLTGARAHRIDKRTPQAIEYAVCEQDVIRPSLAVENKALARRLSGDLDNILLRALDKDPRRRYASVDQFAEDIRRHLTFQPVKARPDTVRYRLVKFARRRRGTVAAVAAVIVTLASGVVMSMREARIARGNLAQVRHLADAFVFNVHDAVRDLPGSTRARQLIIQTGLQYLDTLAKNSRGDWDLQNELASAYQRIGDVQGDVMAANLGNTAGALESYRKAMDLLNSVIAHDPANRGAQLERMVVHARIGGVHSYTGNHEQALASFKEAESLGQSLLAGNPGDEQVRRRLAETHIALGEALRLAGEQGASLEENSRALALLLASSNSHPGDRALQRTLANAYSAVGASQVRLGRLQEGLERYRQSLAGVEQLTRLDPANASYQHDLMQIYTHIGDVLGNPSLPSLGDPGGAADAYSHMLAVARHLYEIDPADQRALSDYAIALTRVAALREDREAEKLSLLRESLKLLHEVGRVNPHNAINQWDLAHGYNLLGDTLFKTGDRINALRAYQESLSLSDSLIKAGVLSPAPTLVSVCEKLGAEAARAGDRVTALSRARRALEVSDQASASARKFLVPQSNAVMGLVYARLARASKSADDRRQARVWLQKSIIGWRAAQSDPAFAPPHKVQMQRVEEALAELQ